MSPGVALAVVSTVGYFGFLVGPPLIGLVAEVSSLRVSFTLVAAVGAAISVLASRRAPVVAAQSSRQVA